MKATDTPPRSLVAYEIALRLIYHSPPSMASGFSPAYVAQLKVDRLRQRAEIPESQHHQLTSLLNSLRYCDADREERLDDLVREISMGLTVAQEDFPIAELMRLLASLQE